MFKLALEDPTECHVQYVSDIVALLDSKNPCNIGTTYATSMFNQTRSWTHILAFGTEKSGIYTE